MYFLLAHLGYFLRRFITRVYRNAVVRDKVLVRHAATFIHYVAALSFAWFVNLHEDSLVTCLRNRFTGNHIVQGEVEVDPIRVRKRNRYGLARNHEQCGRTCFGPRRNYGKQHRRYIDRKTFNVSLTKNL